MVPELNASGIEISVGKLISCNTWYW